MFAVEGGEPVVLTSMTDVKPDASVVGNGVIMSWYDCQYRISKEAILKMSQSDLIAVRVYFGNKWVSVDIPSKNSGKIQRSASCILN